MKAIRSFLRQASTLTLTVLGAFLLVLTIAACNLNFNKNVNGPSAEEVRPSPSPSPSPSASPSPGAKTSDVKSLGIFVYGYEQNPAVATVCVPPPDGQRLVNNTYIVPRGCIAQATATPKTDKDLNGDGKNDDSLTHSRNLTWSYTGAIRLDTGINGEPLFNQQIVPTGTSAGQASVTATLTEPGLEPFVTTRGLDLR